MLDIKIIRDNPKMVETKSRQKGYEVNVDRLLEVDVLLREKIGDLEKLQHQRNELAARFKSSKPSAKEVEEGKKVKEQISKLEAETNKLKLEYDELLNAIPNLPLDDVPVGASEDENKVVKEWGEQIEYDFKPKTHWEIAEARDLLDKQRAAKVAGSRFVYLKGSLVELQLALISFVMSTLSNEAIIESLIKHHQLNVVAKPFVPILPPAMIKTGVFASMDRLDPRDERYKVGNDEDDLWLQGSAEHTLGPMYLNEILPEEELPIRYIGFLTSFRREAGTYGKDTEGIIRMHQFDKLEMEVFSTPETGLDEHLLMVAIQEHLVQELNLPYHLVQKCTADIGKPNARGIDIDTWMPGQGVYRETHTADYMTDYQARRLKTRLRRKDGAVELVHTNDATAFGLARIMAAIIENNQTHDGHFIIPDVLKKYLGGREEL